MLLDNLHGQTTKEFRAKCKTKSNATTYNIEPNSSPDTQVVDAGFGANLKSNGQDILDDMLDDPELWEEWTTARMSVGRKRILCTHVYGKAYERTCENFDFKRVFLKLGANLTVDGSEDHHIHLQGLGHGQFTFEDRDADRMVNGEFDGEMSPDAQARAASDAELDEVSEADHDDDAASGSESDEDLPEPVAFEPPPGVQVYETMPDWVNNVARMKKTRLAHYFTTGWEIGRIKGRETARGEHLDQFFVKYKTERDYLYHDLDATEYGTSAGKHWVLLK